MIKYTFKDIKKYRWLYFVVVILFAVATCVILALIETHSNVQNSALQFYEQYNKDDYVIYKNQISNDDAKEIENISGVLAIEKTLEADFEVTINNDEKRTLRVQSLPKDINKLYYYDQIDEDGIAVSKKFLDANNLIVGDKMTLSLNGETKVVTINASVVSPASIFAIKSWNEPSPDSKYFADAYINYNSFEAYRFHTDYYNKLLLNTDDNIDNTVFEDNVEKSLGKAKMLSKENQISYITVDEEIGDLKTISIFFIFVFMICIVSMLIVLAEKITDSSKKKIAIMKSIGTKNIKVCYIFTLPYLFSFLVSIIVGGALSYVILSILLKVYTSVFYIPTFTLSYQFSNIMIILAIAIIAILSVFTFQYSVVKKMSIARVLKGDSSSGTIKSNKLGNKFSFTLMYVIRNISRNKGRSIFTSLSVILSFILLVTSFFFFDSLSHSLSSRAEDINNYSYRVLFDRAFTKSDVNTFLGKYDYELEKKLPGQLIHFDEELDIVICSIDSLNDAIKLKTLDGSIIEITDDTCVIPYRYKQQFSYNIGDTLTIDVTKTDGEIVTKDLKITDIAYEYTMFAVYISNEYMESIDPDLDYTNAYIKDANTESLYDELISIDKISMVEKYDYIYDSYKGIIKGVSQFAYIILIFSLILLGAIFIGICFVSMNSRKREFAIMKMLGARTGFIFKHLFFETNVLMILGLLLGSFVSSPLKNKLSDLFSNNRISFLPYLEPITYAFIVVTIFSIVNIMLLLFIRVIKNISYKKELFK